MIPADFTDAARVIDDEFYQSAGSEYDRLWDVLDRIRADPEEAQHAPWSNYVSSQDLWGSKIPGTDYTVFWRVQPGPLLVVAHILPDIEG